jgi:hypothetical protein
MQQTADLFNLQTLDCWTKATESSIPERVWLVAHLKSADFAS